MNGKIRVLVVDDSALLRKIISDVLNADAGIEVVGTAPNGQLALARIAELNPDVVTLDVDMPVMDGFTALKKIMTESPRPVIMLSGLTQAGADLTFKCLEAGAVDYFPKPLVEGPQGIRGMGEELCAKVKAIRQQNLGARLARLYAPRPAAVPPVVAAPAAGALTGAAVALGISTGGPAALAQIFPELPEQFPPLLIVQHMPKEFTGAFAERLNRLTKLTVTEAKDGEPVLPNHVYIAPGDRHLLVTRSGTQVRTVLSVTDKVDGHRPSATVLFRSVTQVYGRKAIGVIMTGMGRDGVDGLKELRAAGGVTVGQDQETSVVYGMPGIAAKEQVVDHQVPLNGIIRKVTALLK